MASQLLKAHFWFISLSLALLFQKGFEFAFSTGGVTECDAQQFNVCVRGATNYISNASHNPIEYIRSQKFVESLAVISVFFLLVRYMFWMPWALFDDIVDSNDGILSSNDEMIRDKLKNVSVWKGVESLLFLIVQMPLVLFVVYSLNNPFLFCVGIIILAVADVLLVLVIQFVLRPIYFVYFIIRNIKNIVVDFIEYLRQRNNGGGTIEVKAPAVFYQMDSWDRFVTGKMNFLGADIMDLFLGVFGLCLFYNQYFSYNDTKLIFSCIIMVSTIFLVYRTRSTFSDALRIYRISVND